MAVKDAALKFKRWAVENRLLRRGREDRPPEIADIYALPGEANKAASTVLRAKPISFLGFNFETETIVVYLKGRPTRADERKLPQEVDGYKVVYKKGTAAAWNGKVNTPTDEPYKLLNDQYTCGSSIFLANCVSAGTLGCLVRNDRGVIFGLSNNHVTGGCNHTEIGFPIVAPAPFDSGPNTIDTFTIGRHLECAPMIDGLPENINRASNTDAALFNIIDATRVSSSQRGAFDTPSEVGELKTNMMVIKAGRTTGITKGKVTAVAADYDAVEYDIPEIGLKKTVYYDELYSIESQGNTPFADFGDSGSLVIEVDALDCRRAVGLIIGVSSDLSYALAVPLRSVLDTFKVTIVSGHNA